MTAKLNDDQTRCVTDEVCVLGIALYEGHVEDGQFEGKAVANVGTPEEAEHWLKTGELPERCVRVVDGRWGGV